RSPTTSLARRRETGRRASERSVLKEVNELDDRGDVRSLEPASVIFEECRRRIIEAHRRPQRERREAERGVFDSAEDPLLRLAVEIPGRNRERAQRLRRPGREPVGIVEHFAAHAYTGGTAQPPEGRHGTARPCRDRSGSALPAAIDLGADDEVRTALHREVSR